MAAGANAAGCGRVYNITQAGSAATAANYQRENMSFSNAILTYHSQNVGGADTRNNDHTALRADLEALTRAGVRVVPLRRVADALEGQADADTLNGTVCLSFDDGCDFDVLDMDYPGHGLQRSFLGIMRDFQARFGPEAQPELHATAFVIASEAARKVIDARSLFGKGWISDHWWRQAEAAGLLAIENHGWDHNHPDLAPADQDRGGFTSIDSAEACRVQVELAAETIAERSGRRPELFAYPFGESSAYIREQYFPQFAHRHGCRAALGTKPGPVTAASDRWNLPRYVCGRDWTTPEGLLKLLGPAVSV
jgi:hypothetical protein